MGLHDHFMLGSHAGIANQQLFEELFPSWKKFDFLEQINRIGRTARWCAYMVSALAYPDLYGASRLCCFMCLPVAQSENSSKRRLPVQPARTTYNFKCMLESAALVLPL